MGTPSHPCRVMVTIKKMMDAGQHPVNSATGLDTGHSHAMSMLPLSILQIGLDPIICEATISSHDSFFHPSLKSVLSHPRNEDDQRSPGSVHAFLITEKERQRQKALPSCPFASHSKSALASILPPPPPPLNYRISGSFSVWHGWTKGIGAEPNRDMHFASLDLDKVTRC